MRNHTHFWSGYLARRESGEAFFARFQEQLPNGAPRLSSGGGPPTLGAAARTVFLFHTVV